MAIEVYKLNNCNKKYKDRQFIKAKVRDSQFILDDKCKIFDAYIDTRSIVCKYCPDELRYCNDGIFNSSSGIFFISEDDIENYGGVRRVAILDERSHYVETLNENYYKHGRYFKFRASGNKYYYYLKNDALISCELFINEIARKLKNSEELNSLEKDFILCDEEDLKDILDLTNFKERNFDNVIESKRILFKMYNRIKDTKTYIDYLYEEIQTQTNHIF